MIPPIIHFNNYIQYKAHPKSTVNAKVFVQGIYLQKIIFKKETLIVNQHRLLVCKNHILNEINVVFEKIQLCKFKYVLTAYYFVNIINIELVIFN